MALQMCSSGFRCQQRVRNEVQTDSRTRDSGVWAPAQGSRPQDRGVWAPAQTDSRLAWTRVTRRPCTVCLRRRPSVLSAYGHCCCGRRGSRRFNYDK
ncbi:hypothetical protein COCON_G00019510 [Conger conger]|uniref:Uncharacterized protein n=1 Tax=Conger conger TaxID=82655 RepID=A0A9Q1E477_CONCO|nr:hypothetical protein COCON_G00019510 [Conger conger]